MTGFYLVVGGLARMWECARFFVGISGQHGQFTTYKMGLITREGLLVAIGLTILHSSFVDADAASASLAGEEFGSLSGCTAYKFSL